MINKTQHVHGLYKQEGINLLLSAGREKEERREGQADGCYPRPCSQTSQGFEA